MLRAMVFTQCAWPCKVRQRTPWKQNHPLKGWMGTRSRTVQDPPDPLDCEDQQTLLPKLQAGL